MKTKQQKSNEVKEAEKLIKNNQSIIFGDFSGVDFESLKQLRKQLKKNQAVFKVLKKRLLRVALKNSGIDFDPSQFDAQAGAIFAPGEVSSIASVVYKFSKDLARTKKDFKLLGAYEIAKKNFLNSEEFMIIAKLPTREVLLAQFIGVITGPLRAFMYVLNERGKKMVESK